jgi:alkylation response protein AidB-like acyl-CoA dehydrogenase
MSEGGPGGIPPVAVGSGGLLGSLPRAGTEFAEALHDLLGRADVTAAARRWADGDLAPGLGLWRRLAGLGVTALAVPEEWGGLGASPLDLVVACEELGHHALPGPVAESLAAVPALLAGLEEPGGCGEWLAGLAAGDLIGTLAMPPRLPFAADAEAAGLVLLAQDDAVYRARPGATHRSVDPARSLAEAHRGEVLARDATAAVARALDLGTLACSAQLLGAGRALLEVSVRHGCVRTQFGRPVGAFQAVKHKLADVAIGLEFARPLLDAAALALADDPGLADTGLADTGLADTGLADTGLADTGLADTGLAGTGTAARDVSAAKVACADAAYRAARVALQVHGAIGYTAEHDLSLWLGKVRALVPAWGSQAEHRARVVAGLR